MTHFFESSALAFRQDLEVSIGIKLQLKINDNTSTLLSVKWEADCTKVSLHRMFLHAPKNIMQELACYLRGEHEKPSASIKAYMELNLQKCDYSHRLNVSKLETKGSCYDLKKIYHALNARYFEGKLDLNITWFEQRARPNRKQMTFGLFHDSLRLIKINRVLDNQQFPEYVVAYVVYHEMLHHVCPAYVDKEGRKQIHSLQFKEREEAYQYIKESRQWMKENQDQFFYP